MNLTNETIIDNACGEFYDWFKENNHKFSWFNYNQELFNWLQSYGGIPAEYDELVWTAISFENEEDYFMFIMRFS